MDCSYDLNSGEGHQCVSGTKAKGCKIPNSLCVLETNFTPVFHKIHSLLTILS